jgi:hypothetical protein
MALMALIALIALITAGAEPMATFWPKPPPVSGMMNPNALRRNA